jgi:hypothetical protein
VIIHYLNTQILFLNILGLEKSSLKELKFERREKLKEIS